MIGQPNDVTCFRVQWVNRVCRHTTHTAAEPHVAAVRIIDKQLVIHKLTCMCYKVVGGGCEDDSYDVLPLFSIFIFCMFCRKGEHLQVSLHSYITNSNGQKNLLPSLPSAMFSLMQNKMICSILHLDCFKLWSMLDSVYSEFVAIKQFKFQIVVKSGTKGTLQLSLLMCLSLIQYPPKKPSTLLFLQHIYVPIECFCSRLTCLLPSQEYPCKVIFHAV